jgi:hypothetical protein
MQKSLKWSRDPESRSRNRQESYVGIEHLRNIVGTYGIQGWVCNACPMELEASISCQSEKRTRKRAGLVLQGELDDPIKDFFPIR